MRKSIIAVPDASSGSSISDLWLNLEQIAFAELSSEDPLYPFENALNPDLAGGWKALSPGPQLIRLKFFSPQRVGRIRLEFREQQVERAQEIAVFAILSNASRRELVRQQWTFSPHGATVETEDFRFDLPDVDSLELHIDPGRHDKQVFATLQVIQIG